LPVSLQSEEELNALPFLFAPTTFLFRDIPSFCAEKGKIGGACGHFSSVTYSWNEIFLYYGNYK
jgi:hypothetical protein